MREVIVAPDRDKWLAARKLDVTSTEAASLCGVGRTTRYQLWNAKHLGLTVDFEETEAMRLGKALEAPIAHHIAAEHGMEIEPLRDYIRDPELRLGSSFDFVARDRSYLLEIKLVGPMQFSRGWRETDWGLEAPIDLEAQIQQEMLLAEIPLAFFGVLVGTETHLLRREFDQAVADRLKTEARAFWTSPCPEPDWQIDADFIIALNKQATAGKTIVATEEIETLMAEYKDASLEMAIWDSRRKIAKAKALELIGDAERVEGLSYNLSAKELPAVEVAAHVRKGHRDFRVSERKA